MNETGNTEYSVSFYFKVSENRTEKMLDLTDFISHICFIAVLFYSVLKYPKKGWKTAEYWFHILFLLRKGGSQGLRLYFRT